MTGFCLYIDGGDGRAKVDLTQDSLEEIAVTRQLNDLEQLLKGKSNFAKNISVLGTPETLQVLGNRHRLDLSKDDFDSLVGKEYIAYLTYNGVDVFEGPGILEVDEIVTDHKTGLPSLDCFFTGTRYMWAREFSEMTINSLYDQYTPHTKNPTTVLNSWDKDNYGPEYIGATYYPFSYGGWRRGDAVSIFDLHAHIYIMDMVRRAANKIGWELTGDWIRWKEVKGLTIPAYFETIEPGSDAQTSVNVQTGINFETFEYEDGDRIRSGSALLDPNPVSSIISEYWNSPELGQYQIPYHGVFDISVDADGTNTIPGSHFRLVISSKLKGVLVDQILPTGPGVPAGNLTISAPTDYYQTGDIISITLVNDPSGDPNNRYVSTGTSMAVNIIGSADLADYPSTTLINPTHNYPEDLTVADVLEGVAHIYGLYAITDANRRTINFIPAEMYFNLDIAEDLTPFVDLQTEVVESETEAAIENVYFRFKSANDSLARSIENRLGKPLYGDEQPAVIRDSDEVFQNPTFYPTWFAYFLDGAPRMAIPASSNRSTRYDHTDVTHDLYDYLDEDIGPRILYYDGLQANDPQPPTGALYPGDAEIVFEPEDGTARVTTTGRVPYAYMADQWRAYPYGIDDRIVFGTGASTYLGYSNEFIWSSQYPFFDKARNILGGRDVWYPTLLQIRRSRRPIRVSVRMSETQYLAWQFQTLKYFSSKVLGAGKFLLNAIKDYEPSKGVADMELVQIFEGTDEKCPATLDDLGITFTVIESPTQYFGMTVELTDTSKVEGIDSTEYYGIALYVDDDPTPIPVSVSLPGSGSTDYSFDLFGYNPVTRAAVFVDKTEPGKPQRRIRLVGSIGVRYKSGQLCDMPFAYEMLFDSSGNRLQDDRYAEFFPEPVGAIPARNKVCCFENFVETGDSDSNPTKIRDGIAADRSYTVTEFTVNGVNVKPGVIGQTSPVFGSVSQTVDYIQVNGYGLQTATAVGNDGLDANNFQNLFDFLNGLGLGYLHFEPSGKFRCVEYIEGVPFTLELERDIGGGITTYRLVYDGVTDVQYFIGLTDYTIAYSRGCFSKEDSMVQAVCQLTILSDTSIQVDFGQSIMSDGSIAGSNGTHSYSIGAYFLADQTLVADSEISVTGVPGGTTIDGVTAADWAARWGVASVSGTYGTFTIQFNGIDPNTSIPDMEQVLSDLKITSHTFVDGLQSDTQGEKRIPALQLGTFDNGCFHNDVDYPTFTPVDVGGIIEINNPGGAGSLASEIDNILLAKGATYYTIDDRPQAPNEGVLYEASFQSAPTVYQNTNLRTIQGPIGAPYVDTGAIGELRDVLEAEFGLVVHSDATYDTRLSDFSLFIAGAYLRLEAQYQSADKLQRFKIRYNADSSIHYIVEIRYLNALTYGGVHWVSSAPTP